MSDKRVDIIIAVYNQLAYTRLAVESIMNNTSKSLYSFIIVDNGSRPEIKAYFDSLERSAQIKYIRNETNLGPIRAINQGIKSSYAEYVMVIHNDVLILESGWLDKIVSVMDKDERIGIAGLAGRKEIYGTGCVNEESLKHFLQNEDLNEPMVEDVSEVAVIDGLCFVMRRKLIERIGGLDEEYGYMHCYDLDVSLSSIASCFKNVVVKVSALHIANGGMTRKLRDYKDIVKDDYGLLKKNCKILARKWRNMLPLKVP